MSKNNLINDDGQETAMHENQMDLFALVDAPSEKIVNGKVIRNPYSNSIGDIDFIPRFKRGRDAIIPVEKQAKIKGRLTIENHYRAGKNQLICKIKPALITRTVKNVYSEYHAYPSDREEMIERVIMLIASSRGLTPISMPGGIPRLGIHFTLYEIREELKKINKTRSYDVIREALIVIRDSSTSIIQVDGSKEISMDHNVFSNAILEVSGTGRGRDRCQIAFSDYVVEQIAKINYRQFAFTNVNIHETALARFLHHHLSSHWINATVGIGRKLFVRDVFSIFGKSNIKMEIMRRDIRAALEKLVDAGWFTSVPYSKKAMNNGVVDYYYFLTPTEDFVEEVIRASAKKKGLNILEEKMNSEDNFVLPQTEQYLV